MKVTDFIPVIVNSLTINKSKNQVCLFWNSVALVIYIHILLTVKLQ